MGKRKREVAAQRKAKNNKGISKKSRDKEEQLQRQGRAGRE